MWLCPFRAEHEAIADVDGISVEVRAVGWALLVGYIAKTGVSTMKINLVEACQSHVLGSARLLQCWHVPDVRRRGGE